MLNQSGLSVSEFRIFSSHLEESFQANEMELEIEIWISLKHLIGWILVVDKILAVLTRDIGHFHQFGYIV